MSRNGITGLALLSCLSLSGSADSAPYHGDLHERIAHLDRWILAEPENPAWWLERAELKRRHGDRRSALDDLRQAELLDPSLGRIWYVRGRTHADGGQWPRARECAERFLQLVPGDPAGYELRGRARAALRDAAGAAEDFTLAIRHQAAPSPELFLMRSRCQASLGEAHLQEALEGIEQGLDQLGPAVALELCALDLEVELGRFDAALSRLDGLMRATQRKESYLARKGAILQQAGRTREALRSFEAAREALNRLTRKQRATATMEALAETIESNLRSLHILRSLEREQAAASAGNQN